MIFNRSSRNFNQLSLQLYKSKKGGGPTAFASEIQNTHRLDLHETLWENAGWILHVNWSKNSSIEDLDSRRFRKKIGEIVSILPTV